jgi:hypothetical protein
MIIDQIEEAIKNNTPLFIKGYMDYDFNWEDIVNLVSEAYNTPVGGEVTEEFRADSLQYNPKLSRFTCLKYPSNNGVSFHAEDIFNGAYNLSNKYNIIDEMRKKLFSLKGANKAVVKFSINMTKNSPPLAPHRDTHHVLLTQVLGSARYIIHESIESDPYQSYIDVRGRNFTEYHMEKNDFLFMPYGTIHSIDNSDLRVACIFDIFSPEGSERLESI